MLGTTFGGNYLASVAGLAVLEVMEKENLIKNAATIGTYWLDKLATFPAITGLRGRGLMIGIDLPETLKHVRQDLLFKHHIFTGEAKPNTIRLLPSLAMTKDEADLFLTALNKELQ
jgi:acetylornithine aminotransferase